MIRQESKYYYSYNKNKTSSYFLIFVISSFILISSYSKKTYAINYNPYFSTIFIGSLATIGTKVYVSSLDWIYGNEQSSLVDPLNKDLGYGICGWQLLHTIVFMSLALQNNLGAPAIATTMGVTWYFFEPFFLGHDEIDEQDQIPSPHTVYPNIHRPLVSDHYYNFAGIVLGSIIKRGK